MRGWFEYGYQGFPSGEQRRRFYRQRDDPCGSEDESDFDNETNDRPIHYYPLRESEEKSSSPRHSEMGSSRVSEADGEVEQAHSEHSFPFFSHITAYTPVPAWYGSSFITFTSCAQNSSRRRYGLWHGGAAVANCSVDSQFHLAELKFVSQTSGLSAAPSQTVDYIPFPEDVTLVELINWPPFHPAFQAVAEDTEVEREPVVPRFGHCAVYMDLPSRMLRAFLTTGWIPEMATPGHRRSGIQKGYLNEQVANPEEFELHLSFVIGGTSFLRTVGNGRGTTTVLSNESYTVISEPTLCLTLIREPTETRQGTQFTTCCPLRGAFDLPVAPRLFATLTPLPSMAPAAGDPLKSRAFAYLGGTENGWFPVPIFELTVIRLELPSWRWTAGALPTFGVPPLPRFGHSATAYEGRLLVCGGVTHGRSYLRDLFVLDTTTLVWREVFVPFNRGVPARAFHGAAITPLYQAPQPLGKGIRAYAGPHVAEGAPDCHRAGRAFGHPSHLPTSCDTGRAIREGRHAGVSEDALLLIGGESAEGVLEPSVWVMILHDYTWQKIRFPFQNEVFSFREAVSVPLWCNRGSGSSPRATTVAETMSGTFLSPQRLRQTVLMLHERNLQDKARGLSSKDPASRDSGIRDDHPLLFSTCHGSLFQLLSIPTESCGVTIFGGTQSPPILFATSIVAPTGSLKESTAFWLFCNNTDNMYAKRIFNRSPYLVQNMFAGTQFLNLLHSPEKDNERGHFRRDSSLDAIPSSGFLQQATRLANESLLEDTLSVWIRAARKRLREGSFLST
ncbi:unnamed protein product [Phytomonas sp. EM1]|nr:unnamed protein product [Phytomonas sp. EM1]|eukprot:CCW62282.1 unnamed protein product [Phytomonas sp. isolate EM1]